MTNPTPNWNIILPMMLLAGAGLWAVLWLMILKNRHQSLLDYILGRWRCPKCKTGWSSQSFMSDCLMSEKLECPVCGFKEASR